MLEQSYDSVKIFWLNYIEIFDKLQIVIQKFVHYPEVLEVWLFGSIAELRAVPGSDLDLLLIIDKSELRLIDRIERYQDLFTDIGIGVDIFPYTLDEAENSLVQNAKRTGLCLYQKINNQSTERKIDSLKYAAKMKKMGKKIKIDPQI